MNNLSPEETAAVKGAQEKHFVPKTPSALQEHISAQLDAIKAQVVGQPTFRNMPQSPEELLNLALKTRGFNRKDRRRYFANKRKPGKKVRG